MPFKIENSKVSKIYLIGKEIRERELNSKDIFLKLNQGVNRVKNPEIEEFIKNIDFEERHFSYPPNNGLFPLRKVINEEFFDGKADSEDIVISPGSVGALDMIFQLLDIDNFYIPTFFWGPYKIMSDRRGLNCKYYDGFIENLDSRDGIIICDPNNPTGEKLDDDKLYEWIKILDSKGVIIIFDSPYRRLFTDRSDTFFQKLSKLENVVIVESFSKSLSLPGGRIGFIHSTNKPFTKEISSRFLYSCGGVSTFAQVIVENLLSNPLGIEKIKEFKKNTTSHIKKNLSWLYDNGLIERSIYKRRPEGLFAIVNRSERDLMKNFIGAVELPFFTEVKEYKEKYANCSRICVSVDHGEFVRYLERVL
ncbi:MAG: hypothetical protein CSA15_03180 [Candidatus Delongbacteria bacterium]|nr:MAG: hypothetical protein CSA15_03180 [Candidatus Delongbacteria bacterium]